MEIIRSIERILEAHRSLPFVVGISGGADSTALLRAFHMLNIPCTAAHLNHQLRGEESDADAAFVRRLAADLGVPMIEKSADVKMLAAQSGLSIEMAARQARHDFFRELDGAVIVLGHHADDQIETFMLKLARGAGTDGLSGMPVFQELDTLKILRPMLHLRRHEILQWLEKHDFPWREDASNTDESFLRNKVRHTVLPMLENEFNPNFGDALLRTMEILRAENEWMDGMVDENCALMNDLPLGARRRKLRRWLFEQGAAEADFETVEQLLALMDKGEGTAVYELSDRQRVIIEYGKPRFEDAGFQPLKTSWILRTEKGSGWIKDTSRIGDAAAQASVSAQKLGKRTLEVRTVQPGDRMAPLGMAGTRKLQDILTDLKVPQRERSTRPVVICGTEIIWLPGYRIARGWEVDGQAAESVHIKLEQNRTE